MTRWQYQGFVEPVKIPIPSVSHWTPTTENPQRRSPLSVAMLGTSLAFVPLVAAIPSVTPLSWQGSFPDSLRTTSTRPVESTYQLVSPLLPNLSWLTGQIEIPSKRSALLLTEFGYTRNAISPVAPKMSSWVPSYPDKFDSKPLLVENLTAFAFSWIATETPVAATVSPAYMITASTGTTWSGQPFSLVNGGPSVLTRQILCNSTTAFLSVSGNGNPGPYTATDGTNFYQLLSLFEIMPTTGSLTEIGFTSSSRG